MHLNGHALHLYAIVCEFRQTRTEQTNPGSATDIEHPEEKQTAPLIQTCLPKTNPESKVNSQNRTPYPF